MGYRSFYDDRPEHRDHGLVPALWTEYGVGDGCQAATAEDMAVYLRMFMNGGTGPAGRVISEDSFHLMTQRAIATQQWGGAHYGYGLTLADVDGHAYLGHGGSTPGFVSGMISDLDDGIGVVVLVNGYVESYGAIGMTMHILRLLRAGLSGQELPPPLPAINPELVSNAADYAGPYSADGETPSSSPLKANGSRSNGAALMWSCSSVVKTASTCHTPTWSISCWSSGAKETASWRFSTAQTGMLAKDIPARRGSTSPEIGRAFSGTTGLTISA